MTVDRFANSIRFQFLSTKTPLRTVWRWQRYLSKLGLSVEFVTTALPSDRIESRKLLKGLCPIPRMSTYAIAAIIDKAVSAMPPDTCFVNVGVWNGFSFLAGLVNNPDKTVIGVDNFSQFDGPRDAFLHRFRRYRSTLHTFYEMDYREYFAKVHQDPIGFYIYDGEHSYENQLTGLKVAEPFFADGCLILVDDTNLPDARQATYDFMAESQHRYRVVFDRTTEENCHPTFWNGVMLLELCRS